MSTGLDLWSKFLLAFASAIAGLPQPERHRMLTGAKERTRVYGLAKSASDGVFPRMTAELGMSRFDREYLRVDGTYQDLKGFPAIWIESENEIGRCGEEMDRLCYVRGLLKVLVVCSPWPNDSLRQSWITYVEQNHLWIEETPKTLYGFIVLSPKEKYPTFHCFSVASDGATVSAEQEIPLML